MQAISKSYLTPEEYLALERQAQTKSEYLRGDVFAMSGASRQHVTIMSNAVAYLVARFKGRPCVAYGSDRRVKVSPTALYTYPDVSVVCGAPQFEDYHQDTLLNPAVIIEILSTSSESYDRGDKFGHYRTLESLSDYILISQNRPLVEHYARQADNSWLLKAYEGLETTFPLPSIGCELPMADIYDKVEWPKEVAKMTGVRLVRDEPGHYEYEFEGGVYADRPDPPNLYR